MKREEQDFNKFLNKEVVIIANVDSDRPFTYHGKIVCVGNILITIRDRKDGEFDLAISRVISIKLKDSGAERSG